MSHIYFRNSEDRLVFKHWNWTLILRTIKQFYGYIWVGIIAFVIDAGLLMILVRLGFHYIIANSISFIIANAFNFLAGHYLVFRKNTRIQNLLSTYLAVLSISIAGLLLNDAIMFVAVDLIKIHLLEAKISATIIVMLWNFGARKAWVYT